MHTLSSQQHDSGDGVAVDRFGNSYVTGRAEDLEGLPDLPDRWEGVWDVVLAKYDRAGRLQWVHTLGAPEEGVTTHRDGLYDIGYDVAVDDVGGVYITGITDGVLPGSVEVGPGAFIAKYSSAGQRLWVRTLGPPSGPDDTRPRRAGGLGIAVGPDGNVVVTGFTRITLPGVSEPTSGNVDLFITKYNSSGQQLWIHQLADFETGRDISGSDVAVDRSGTVYVTGTTSPAAGSGFPSEDTGVVVASYDASGARRWVRQMASTGSDLSGNGIAVDGVRGIFVVGNHLNADSPDEMFIAKYSTTGESQWVRQYGAPYQYISSGIAIDRSRDLYLVGTVRDRPNGQRWDVAVAKFDRTGTPLWTRYIGGSDYDIGTAIALDPSGNPVITGSSGYDFPGAPEPLLENGDIFIAKLNAHAPTK